MVQCHTQNKRYNQSKQRKQTKTNDKQKNGVVFQHLIPVTINFSITYEVSRDVNAKSTHGVVFQ